MAHIHRPRHQRQLVRTDPFGKFNCTAYSAAMFADAVTLGGTRVTGRHVRALSSEPVPAPGSPGLNIPQVGKVLTSELGIEFDDRTGQGWAKVLEALDQDRRVIAQISYRELGPFRCQTGDFGHAMLLQAKRARPGAPAGFEILANDPLCKAEKWYTDDAIRASMEQFGDETHVPGPGLRWGTGRVVPRIA